MLYQSYEQHKQDESNIVINNLVNNTAVTVRVINLFEFHICIFNPYSNSCFASIKISNNYSSPFNYIIY